MIAGSCLTKAQHIDIQSAIYHYLQVNGFKSAAEALSSQTEISQDSKYHELLEKKWISVIRLQKRVLELESQLEKIKSQLQEAPIKRIDNGTLMFPEEKEWKQWTGHRGAVTRLIIHPIHSWLISCSEDATIKFWNLETGEKEKTLTGHTRAVLDMDISERYLVTGSADSLIKLWDEESNFQCIRTFVGHDQSVSGVKLSQDYIFSSSRDTTIRVWNLKNGECIRTLYGHSEWVKRIQIIPESPLLLSCATDGSLYLWNWMDNQLLSETRPHDHVIEQLILLTKEQSNELCRLMNIPAVDVLVISISRDKTLVLADPHSQQILVKLEGHDNWVRDGVLMGNGLYIASVSDDQSMKVWQLETGKCLRTYPQIHKSMISAITFASSILATGSEHGEIKLWKCSH